MKNQTGWIISWNQDCWEKYQQPLICWWYHPNCRKWRTKEPFEEGERGELKSWLKTQKTKIMASSPTISWQIDGGEVEIVTDFIFLVSKITAGSDCSHKIKRHLILGKKVIANLDSTLKSRDITLPTKDHMVKAMIFPVVMYRCENLPIKKAEC